MPRSTGKYLVLSAVYCWDKCKHGNTRVASANCQEAWWGSWKNVQMFESSWESVRWWNAESIAALNVVNEVTIKMGRFSQSDLTDTVLVSAWWQSNQAECSGNSHGEAWSWCGGTACRCGAERSPSWWWRESWSPTCGGGTRISCEHAHINFHLSPNNKCPMATLIWKPSVSFAKCNVDF